ncbi:SMI1/KNR4 family protein [Cellulomonas sp. NPDC055163]
MEPTDDGRGWAGTRERVHRLRAADRDLRGFGAASHRLVLAPALTEAQVDDAERRLGIRFPEEYRSFLLEVGSGGAGPGYGLTTLRDGDDGWAWEGDGSAGARLDRLHVPARAVDELRALQAAVPEIGPLPEDFPTVAAWEAASAAWERAD